MSVHNKIVIVGFMGAGKSSVAKVLGKRLGLKWIECDELVEKKLGCTIAESVDKQGEQHFRSVEREVCNELSEVVSAVISTGGGSVENGNCIESLKANGGVIVYLKVNFNTVLDRIKDKSSRPLLRNIESAKDLYHKRQEAYLNYSDFIVEADELTIEEVAEAVCRRLRGQ